MIKYRLFVFASSWFIVLSFPLNNKKKPVFLRRCLEFLMVVLVVLTARLVIMSNGSNTVSLDILMCKTVVLSNPMCCATFFMKKAFFWIDSAITKLMFGCSIANRMPGMPAPEP